MKFGTLLSSNLHLEWKFQYVDYDELKKLLKSAEEGTGFGLENESIFVQKAEQELDKVHAFCNLKSEELSRGVEHIEKILRERIKEKALDLVAIQTETSRITLEVAELARFIRLNYSAFMKILKKHDKHTSFNLKNLFMIRLQSRPFYKLSFDSLIIRLSKLYEIVRNQNNPVSEETENNRTPTNSFIRKTTKYWVHPDNVTEVKIHVLKNLPVLIFANKGSNDPDPAITSIYLDNDGMDLYKGRLEKTQGAEAHRIRWYGNMDQTEIFFERKTHHEDWTGENSVKTRFSIKEKYVNEYMRGKYTMDKAVAKLRARGEKSDKELDDMLQLSRDIQVTILEKGLKPMIRTFYNRTAFQLPGDATVRISLDTELTMIREDNYSIARSGENWRRMDAGTIAPFDHLPKQDVCNFPYAVLEVKLQTHVGATAPLWVQSLIDSNLVEEVPKFSKFIHGCASLLESRVTLLPFWLPQMNKDIRKPAPDEKKEIQVAVSSDKGETRIEIEEEDESANETTPLIGSSTSTAIAPGRAAVKGKSKDKGKGKEKKVNMVSLKKHDGQDIPSSMNGKRIVIPVRVEPKVFFANERTFLSWLHFCIVLGGLALGLLNFGDAVGQISGLLFTFVAMVFMIYSLFLYQWRAEKIRNRDAGPYDDRVGPTVLVIALFGAVLVNFYLKFSGVGKQV